MKQTKSSTNKKGTVVPEWLPNIHTYLTPFALIRLNLSDLFPNVTIQEHLFCKSNISVES